MARQQQPKFIVGSSIPEPAVKETPVLSKICATCQYWKEIPATENKYGECRFLPPFLVDSRNLTPSGPILRFGLTLSTCDCGHHKFRS